MIVSISLNLTLSLHDYSSSVEQRPTSIDSLMLPDHAGVVVECDGKKLNSPGASSTNSEIFNSTLNNALKRQWGSEITVYLVRDQNKGFGISIIGGKDNKSGLSSLTGILIKKILPDSPAAKSGLLKTGDRVLEVDDIDLRNATHDEAVEAIKKAKSPVKFVVQCLISIVSI